MDFGIRLSTSSTPEAELTKKVYANKTIAPASIVKTKSEYDKFIERANYLVTREKQS